MYKLQVSPDTEATLDNGSIVTPIATLKDEYGGISHIIEDDHCYVLINGSANRDFLMTYHWYQEAVDVLKGLPVLSQA